MIKHYITAPAAYESPRCETVETTAESILCASENGGIDDLGDNIWEEL